MTKRQITATAPDGTQVTINVGPKRVVGAIRIMDVSTWGAEYTARHGAWYITVHKTVENAITGPNQTPMWNKHTRWAIAIDANDQASGAWLPASK